MAVLVVLPIRANAGDGDAQAFRSVIEAQIAAFARDDGQTAFSFASPDIQQIFGTPENFMEMVRAGFTPVYRPQSYRFEDPVHLEGQPAQPVTVIGPDGRGVIALYRMQQQDDGSWRIAGVTLHPVDERGI
jgi:hypothetical protein